MPVFFFKEIGILNPQKAGHQCHQFQTLRNPEKGKFHPDFVCFFLGGGPFGGSLKNKSLDVILGREMGADITGNSPVS